MFSHSNGFVYLELVGEHHFASSAAYGIEKVVERCAPFGGFLSDAGSRFPKAGADIFALNHLAHELELFLLQVMGRLPRLTFVCSKNSRAQGVAATNDSAQILPRRRAQFVAKPAQDSFDARAPGQTRGFPSSRPLPDSIVCPSASIRLVHAWLYFSARMI